MRDGNIYSPPSWDTCRVTRLKIGRCRIHWRCFRVLLDRVLEMRHLTELILERNPPAEWDINDFASKLLLSSQQQGKPFRYFGCFESTWLDVGAILHILETGKPQIVVEYQPRNGRKNQQILYYSYMNRYGRDAAQDPNTSKYSFVQYLIDLQTDPRLKQDEAMKNSVLYGLLLESPGLWSAFIP